MKKFLSIFLIAIFVFAATAQITKAISFVEIFTSLSDKLYMLRDLLTAQVSPPSPTFQDIWKNCRADQECIPFLNNCSCEYITLNASYLSSYISAFPNTCMRECGQIQPPIIKCTNGQCAASNTSPGGGGYGDTTRYNCNSTTYQCISAVNGIYTSLAECQSACTAPSSKYNCNTTTYQCASSTSGTYSSLTDCQTSCKAPVGSKPTITDAQRKCTSDSQCRIIETDCCGCSYGGDYKTKFSINYTSVSAFNSLLTKYCTDSKLRPCKVIGASNCRLTPMAKCVSGLCTADWPVVTPPTLTDIMKKCTQNTDCSVVESACCGCDKGGNEMTKIGINKTYLTTFSNLVKNYCYKSSQDTCSSTTNNCKAAPTATCINNICMVKPTEKPTITDEMRKCTTVNDCSVVETDCCGCSSGGSDTSKKSINKNYLTYFDNLTQSYCGKTMCITLFNCKEEPTLACENNLCIAKFTTSEPVTYQWYKTNVTLGDPKELWYQAVVSCAPQNSTKEKWEQCFKDYFTIQKIGIKSLIVGTVPIGSCTPIGCQAPVIQVEVSQEHKTKMVYLGFSEIDDPTKPVDPYIIKIDLATQGLLYGKDKLTGNIIYEIVNKTTSDNCGNGVCETIEKYLYEIDLKQHCSINDEEIINYKHCYSDCKGKMDTGKSVTSTEFNLLKPQCSNKVVEEPEETKSFMPMPKKPITQMTQEEKNEYIKELQVFLIELLTQLINLLKIQKGIQ